MKKSQFKNILNKEIKEILNNPPSHNIPKSTRYLFDSQNKIELLKNEYVIIDREVKRLEKELSNGEGDTEQIQFHLDKNKKIKQEIEFQIQNQQQ